jgi:hypothetical protein
LVRRRGIAVVRSAKSARATESAAIRPAKSTVARSTATRSAKSTAVWSTAAGSTKPAAAEAATTASTAAATKSAAARPAARAAHIAWVGEAIPAARPTESTTATESAGSAKSARRCRRVVDSRLSRLLGRHELLNFRTQHNPFFIRRVKLRLDRGQRRTGGRAATTGRLRHRQSGKRRNRQPHP